MDRNIKTTLVLLIVCLTASIIQGQGSVSPIFR
jgi:hypothetical protein